MPRSTLADVPASLRLSRGQELKVPGLVEASLTALLAAGERVLVIDRQATGASGLIERGHRCMSCWLASGTPEAPDFLAGN